MADNDEHTRELLGERDQKNAESIARSLVWAMNDMLPWHAEHPRAGMHLIRSQHELQILWQQQGGAPGEMPHVNFHAEMVAAIFLDEGAYKRAPGICSIEQVGNEIRIYYEFSERSWSMINPCSVIKIPRADGEPVFIESTAELGAPPN